MTDSCKNCQEVIKRNGLLEQYQNDLAIILNDSRDILYRYNFQTNSYDYISPSIESMTGYPVQEMENAGAEILLDTLHPDDKIQFLEVFQGLIDGSIQDSEIHLQYRTLHKDGHYVHRSDYMRILRDDDGKITSLIGNNRDMTHQWQIDQELKASRERYKRLAEATFEGIILHKQNKILDVNQQFLDMFGYTLEEIKQISGLDMFAPQSRELVADKVSSGYEGTYEALGMKKDGTVFSVMIHSKQTHFEGQSVRIGVIRDLTEEKKLQQQLAEREKKYRELYNNAHVALFRTDLDGTLLDCNRATLGFFGYSPDERNYLGNYNVTDAYIDKQRRNQFVELLSKNKRVRNFEAQFHHQNGISFWVSIDAELYAREGYIEGALYNITAEKVLTKAEKEVFSYILEGKTNKEIASETNRSIRTIEDHRAHIMSKLGAQNLVDLTQKAYVMSFKSEQ